VRVVSPRNFFLFTPLLPSASTGTISPSAVCSPIRELISYKADPLYRRVWYMLRGHLPAEVKYYPAEATAVDVGA
jgi:NADH:ubiquinone reductase (non-electrogenic)